MLWVYTLGMVVGLLNRNRDMVSHSCWHLLRDLFRK